MADELVGQGRYPRAMTDDVSGPMRRPGSENGISESLFIELRDNSCAVAAFNTELRNLREVVAALTKVIKDGNGQPSLITKVSLLEQSMENLEQWKALADVQVRDLIKEDKADVRETRGQKLRFYGGIVPSAVALIVAILTLIFK